MLGVPIDLKEVYETNDRSFVIWLWALCEKVAGTHEKRARNG